MEHLYTLEFAMQDNMKKRYVFKIVEFGKMGWVSCRMIEIHDIYPDGIRHSIDYYTPEIHDGKGHMMSYLYKARYNKKNLHLNIFLGAKDAHCATLFLRTPCFTCLEGTLQSQRSHAPQESH